MASYGSKTTSSFSNTLEGFKDFYKEYNSLLKEALVTLETTGGYEKCFLKKGCCVHRANTRQVYSFIKSLWCVARADAFSIFFSFDPKKLSGHY